MTFSPLSLIRLVALLAVGSTILAVGVSRLEPPEAVHRIVRPVTNVNVNDFFLKVGDRQPRWIDSETGKLTVLRLQGDDVLESASCSPWVNEAGQRQVVGRWSSRTWNGPKSVSHSFGLGRYSFPDGRLLNQIPCETMPVGPPIWYPGTQARVLFASGDGQLYRFAFESERPSLNEFNDPADQAPSVLTWGCAKPGVGDVFISDVSWPTDPRMGGCLVAAMRTQYLNGSGSLGFTHTHIWALKLDPAGTRIIAADQLTGSQSTEESGSNHDERSPVVARLADGSIALAFTRQVDKCSNWAVCLANLEFDSSSRFLCVSESQIRQFNSPNQPAPLSFSPDGRWLNGLLSGVDSTKMVIRFPTNVLASTVSGSRRDPAILTR